MGNNFCSIISDSRPGLTLAEKILKAHCVDGEFIKGREIGLRIDQTLTQDATGTMTYLEYETMGIPRVKTECSVAYIDHNTLQSGFENADDHRFIGSEAKKHGIYFSRPGNGICHQVHLERFGIPGKTLIGSDSHTPTGGGLGMLAIGAGGLDVAVVMGGGAYYITYPKIVKINLSGKLSSWVSAKDVILEILGRLTVKGGVGKIIEYCGEGVKSLSVPERATITNMGAELGATTSIFPSDEITRRFLLAQGREKEWRELKADENAVYDEELDIDLSCIVPLAACPHSPDNIKKIDEMGTLKIDQVCIGSCTNSSYTDMMKVAYILKGNTVHPDVSLSIAPGSRQVLEMLADNGALRIMIDAGARILESACGPCIGMGQAPNSGGISLRTFNRNFEGRSGTKDGKIYLVSPETAAVSAINGYLINPVTYGSSMIYDFEDSAGIIQGIHNKDVSIEGFAHSCFRYALDTRQDVWFATKDTISKKYDHRFKDIFARIYEEEYKERFKAAGITYFYTLIDDAVARVIRSNGGYIWACKNYDGDVMSDMIATAYGSLAMMTSVLVSPDGNYEYEAAHGTVQRHYYKYRKGEKTSTNPVATIFAWTGALRKRGELDDISALKEFADRLEAASLKTISDGIMTGDLAAISSLEKKQSVDTETFLREIRNRMER